MNMLKRLASLLLISLVAACGGGGGDAGTNPLGTGSGTGTGGTGGSTAPAAADLNLTLSTSSVDNSGSKTVLASVTAVDAARNTVSGVPVTFSVDNNAVAQVSVAATGATGTVTATVSIGADRSNR